MAGSKASQKEKKNNEQRLFVTKSLFFSPSSSVLPSYFVSPQASPKIEETPCHAQRTRVLCFVRPEKRCCPPKTGMRLLPLVPWLWFKCRFGTPHYQDKAIVGDDGLWFCQCILWTYRFTVRITSIDHNEIA
jgi:hypothetical protein